MGETTSDKGRRRPRWPWIVLVGLGLVTGLLYVCFPVERFRVVFMAPTLWSDDYIVARRGGGVPERGEIVGFHLLDVEEPHPDVVFMMRVIGVPGDRLAFIDGRPIINGFSLPHCRVGRYEVSGKTFELFVEWLGDYAYGVLLDAPVDGGSCEKNTDCEEGKSCEGGICGLVEGPYDVAPGEVFVVTDRRINSYDSRKLRGDDKPAGVPIDTLVSRPRMVLFSLHKGLSGRSFLPVYGPPLLPPKMASLEPALEKCWKQKPPKTSP